MMNARNKEKQRAYNKKYNLAHKEERREYNLAHREEHRAKSRKYYKENIEKCKEKQRVYNLVHREEKREQNREHRLVHREELNKRRREGFAALKRYNLSKEQYDEMLAKQGGVCAICGKVRGAKKGSLLPLDVDEDHKAGKIRGLLCDRCNLAIGILGDCVEGVEKALNYLKKYEE